MEEIYRTIQVRLDLFLETISEANEAWGAWIEDMRGYYESISKVIHPWRVLVYPCILAFVVYLWWSWPPSEDEEEGTTRVWWRAPSSESISSTPATTPEVEPTPPTTPRVDPQTTEMLSQVQSLLETHKETMEFLREQEVQRQATAAADAIRGQHIWGPADQQMLTEMSAKVEKFASILEADRSRVTPPLEQPAPRVGPAGPPRSSSTSPIIPENGLPEEEPTLLPCRVSTPEKRAGEEDPADPTTGKKSRTHSLDQKLRLARLEKATRSPAQIFKEEMKKLEDWDEEFTRVTFPGAYKARVAPEFLTDVYRSNKKGREFALDWLRDRELLNCKEAYNGLIQPLSTIDTLLFSEPPLENFINHEGVERQAKKAYATMIAYQKVAKESDWKKPAGAGGSKGWRSKVDWREASLIDPDLKQDTGVIQLREVEEESRKEIDREATLQRTKQKLAEGSRTKEAAP